MKEVSGKSEELDKYDTCFYLDMYKDHTERGVSKDKLTEQLLKTVYRSEPVAGMTMEQYYTEQYYKER